VAPNGKDTTAGANPGTANSTCAVGACNGEITGAAESATATTPAGGKASGRGATTAAGSTLDATGTGNDGCERHENANAATSAKRLGLAAEVE